MGDSPHAHTLRNDLTAESEGTALFTELVQMLLFLSAGVAACTKETEELPTSHKSQKGRLARQVLHNIVVDGVTAVGLVPSVFIL